MDTVSGFKEVQPQWCGDFLHSRLRARALNWYRSARKRVRVKVAQDNASVGYRSLGSPFA